VPSPSETAIDVRVTVIGDLVSLRTGQHARKLRFRLSLNEPFRWEQNKNISIAISVSV
jgi:hypothetical protein